MFFTKTENMFSFFIVTEKEGFFIYFIVFLSLLARITAKFSMLRFSPSSVFRSIKCKTSIIKTGLSHYCQRFHNFEKIYVEEGEPSHSHSRVSYRICPAHLIACNFSSFFSFLIREFPKKSIIDALLISGLSLKNSLAQMSMIIVLALRSFAFTKDFH